MIEPNEETIFNLCIPVDAFSHPEASLAILSGYRIPAPPDLLTYVTTTVEKAWDTPLNALSCEQVRMLVGQRFGLQWLSRAVGHFVHDYPAAEINYYPGDLTMMALKAFDEIVGHDPQAGMLLMTADYRWIPETYAFDEELREEALRLIERISGSIPS